MKELLSNNYKGKKAAVQGVISKKQEWRPGGGTELPTARKHGKSGFAERWTGRALPSLFVYEAGDLGAHTGAWRTL